MTETRTRPPRRKNRLPPRKRPPANHPKHDARAIANGDPKRGAKATRNDGPKHVVTATRDDGPKRVVTATRDDGPKRVVTATRDGDPKHVVKATRDGDPKRVVKATVLNGRMLDVVETGPGPDNEESEEVLVGMPGLVNEGAPIHCSRSLTATATEASRRRKSTTSPKH